MKEKKQFIVNNHIYTEDQLLGRGGQASVYKVKDETNNEYALKYFSPVNSELKHKIQKEITLLKKLNHECIPSFHEYYEQDNYCLYTMEYIKGESLDSLTKKKIDPQKALRYIKRIATIMNTVHSQGIVHKDLTPQNVILRPDDSLYIVDFGIAYDLTEEKRKLNPSFDGKWGYLSPSRLQGKNPSPQDDIFSLGVIFYELLHGQMPWKVDGSKIIQFIQEESIHPETFDKHIPPPIISTCVKMLEKKQAERYISMNSVVQDLNHIVKYKLDKSTKKNYLPLAFTAAACITVGSFFISNNLPTSSSQINEHGVCVKSILDNQQDFSSKELSLSSPLITIANKFDNHINFIKNSPEKAPEWYPQFYLLNKELETSILPNLPKETSEKIKNILHTKVFCSIYHSIKKNTNNLESLDEYYSMLDAYLEFQKKIDYFPEKELITTLVGMHYGRVKITSANEHRPLSLTLEYDRFYKSTRSKKSKTNQNKTISKYKTINVQKDFILNESSIISKLNSYFPTVNHNFDSIFGIDNNQFFLSFLNKKNRIIDSEIHTKYQLSALYYLAAHGIFKSLVEKHHKAEVKKHYQEIQINHFFSFCRLLNNSINSSSYSLIDNVLFKLDLDEYLDATSINCSLHLDYQPINSYDSACYKSLLKTNKFRFDIKHKLSNYSMILEENYDSQITSLQYIQENFTNKEISEMFASSIFFLSKKSQNRIFPDFTFKYKNNKKALLNNIEYFHSKKGRLRHFDKIEFSIPKNYSSIFDVTNFQLTTQNYIIQQTFRMKLEVRSLNSNPSHVLDKSLFNYETNIDNFNLLSDLFFDLIHYSLGNARDMNTYKKFQDQLSEVKDKKYYNIYLLNKLLYLYTLHKHTNTKYNNTELIYQVFISSLITDSIDTPPDGETYFDTYYDSSKYFTQELNYFFNTFNEIKISETSLPKELKKINDSVNEAYRRYGTKYQNISSK